MNGNNGIVPVTYITVESEPKEAIVKKLQVPDAPKRIKSTTTTTTNTTSSSNVSVTSSSGGSKTSPAVRTTTTHVKQVSMTSSLDEEHAGEFNLLSHYIFIHFEFNERTQTLVEVDL